MNEANLTIFPNTTKTREKDNSIPLYVRITLNRKKAEAKLPIRICFTEFKKWDKRLMCVNDSKSEANKRINYFKSKFENFIRGSFHKLDTLTATDIRNYLIDKKEVVEQTSVLDFVESYYSERVLPSGEITLGTKKNYRKAINHFRNFMELNKIEKVGFEKLKPDFGIKFYYYLTSNLPQISKEAMTKESASGNIKKIKKIFGEAIIAELAHKNPFIGIRIKIEHKRKEKLNIYQVRQLYIHNFYSNTFLEKCRDLFLFQIFSGLSFSDMINLKRNQLSKTMCGTTKLVTIRGKTNQEVNQIANKFLQRLIDKFSNSPSAQIRGTVVPFINLKDYNLQLKMMAAFFNIPISLSSHYGRHAFRQLLTEAEITDMPAIYSYMGWSNKKSMDSIYSNVTEKQLGKLANDFELYLSKHLIKDENI